MKTWIGDCGMNLNKRSRHGHFFPPPPHHGGEWKRCQAGNFKSLPTRYSPCMLKSVWNPNQGGISAYKMDLKRLKRPWVKYTRRESWLKREKAKRILHDTSPLDISLNHIIVSILQKGQSNTKQPRVTPSMSLHITLRFHYPLNRAGLNIKKKNNWSCKHLNLEQSFKHDWNALMLSWVCFSVVFI